MTPTRSSRLESLRAEARKAKRGEAEAIVMAAWGAAIDSVRAQTPIDVVGCGDHSCVVAPPKGMGTNGGCRCSERDLRAAVRAYRSELARINAERAGT